MSIEQDDFFLTGLITSNMGIGAASTLPSTNAARSTAIMNMKLSSGYLGNNVSQMNNQLGSMTSRDFFQKRKFDQQKKAVEYLDKVRSLIKMNERQMIGLESIKTLKQDTAADQRKLDKRALSQRRLTKDDKQRFAKMYEESQTQTPLVMNNGQVSARLKQTQKFHDKLFLQKTLNHIDNQEGFKTQRVDHQHKINAQEEFEDIKGIALAQWDEVFGDKTSDEIQQLIKEYEAIPYVKSDVKMLLENKEKEMIKKRNSDLFKIKMLEKQLQDHRKVLEALVLEATDYDINKMERLQKEIDETYHKTQNEELHTLILQHMRSRDKKLLLDEQEPIPKRKQKLDFLNNQIAQCHKDKLEYEREIRIMENDFLIHERHYSSKQISDENFFRKEKNAAIVINKYKELYKMEKIKREEEEAEREKDKQHKRDQQVRVEKQEKIKQEKLRIETEKIIEDKEEEFKRIQQHTMVQGVEQLPQYMTDYEIGQDYLKNQIDEIDQQNLDKRQHLDQLKQQLYQIMLRKNQIANENKLLESKDQNVNVKEKEMAELSNKKALRKQMLEKRNQMDQNILNVCGVMQKLSRQLKIQDKQTTIKQNLSTQINMKGAAESALIQINKKNVDENVSLGNIIDSFYNPDHLGIDKNIYISKKDDNGVSQLGSNIVHPLMQNKIYENNEEQNLGLREEKEANQEFRQQYLKKKGKI
ncbi:UNKNOWN [Stylonychia lemnae]|uniref:Uncharacterized protein n=1 Tax=Stylonychia lemnae TaxID=5949 RepID=A0A077ZZE1_STYLE|nr:UNKNOWN [Stylonychia lemnae]|eukprot:CDW74957.1 UNKNOWN [Stylonychia lemnae]